MDMPAVWAGSSSRVYGVSGLQPAGGNRWFGRAAAGARRRDISGAARGPASVSRVSASAADALRRLSGLSRLSATLPRLSHTAGRRLSRVSAAPSRPVSRLSAAAVCLPAASSPGARTSASAGC